MSTWLWLAAYFAVLAGIAIYTVHVRNAILADAAEAEKDKESWQEWQKEAAKQDGTTGPVQRRPIKADEPPMLTMMRDNFGAILGASIVFPAIILGFLLVISHGMLRQWLDAGNDNQSHRVGTTGQRSQLPL